MLVITLHAKRPVEHIEHNMHNGHNIHTGRTGHTGRIGIHGPFEGLDIDMQDARYRGMYGAHRALNPFPTRLSADLAQFRVQRFTPLHHSKDNSILAGLGRFQFTYDHTLK